MPHVVVDAYGVGKAMEARQDTWGHLAPKFYRRYRVALLIATSGYSSLGWTIVETEFPDDLPDSPWLFDAMSDYISNADCDGTIEEGKLYWWTGTFRLLKGPRNGRCRENYLDEAHYQFEGEFTEVPLPPRPPRKKG